MCCDKIKTIDLFAGCGGLMDGFEQSGMYRTLACVEWEKAQCQNLAKRLKEKWQYKAADDMVLRFDIQRTEELFNGWTGDENYGQSGGLDNLVKSGGGVDLIVGGPPCQAYSMAGRIRDKNGMRDDYRNYLFESYIKVVKHYRPKAFVFENVPGIFSARPGGVHIIDIIQKAFDEAGYLVLPDLKKALLDFSEFGVPQKRKRIIILGLSKEVYGSQATALLHKFYEVLLPAHKCKVKTVRDAIGDLPALYPLPESANIHGKKYSHSMGDTLVPNHIPRFHNTRDMGIFYKLEKDIEDGTDQYTSTKSLCKLYEEETGHTSTVHKYYVLRWDQPSNLIPAHLYKDGLRHIHPDSKQARSITVREAARLQTFPDDYIFVGSQMDQYKMIGNAVPPAMSKIIAQCVYELLFQNKA